MLLEGLCQVWTLLSECLTSTLLQAHSIMNFVVKYSLGGQSYLRPHHDASTYTINVALSEPRVDHWVSTERCTCECDICSLCVLDTVPCLLYVVVDFTFCASISFGCQLLLQTMCQCNLNHLSMIDVFPDTKVHVIDDERLAVWSVRFLCKGKDGVMIL